MKLKLALDTATTLKLAEAAGRERRPIAAQAEVLLQRALGLGPLDSEFEAITHREIKRPAVPPDDRAGRRE